MGSVVAVIVILYIVFYLKKKRSNIIVKDTANPKIYNHQQIRHRTKEIDDAIVTLMEDRKHDWLAKQLKEERDLQAKLYDMFEIRITPSHTRDGASQLRLEHQYNCDAAQLRNEHFQNCDANSVRQQTRQSDDVPVRQSTVKMTPEEMNALKARIKERNS